MQMLLIRVMHQLDAVAVDFAKAFDKVPHRRLCEKLLQYVKSFYTGSMAFCQVEHMYIGLFWMAVGVPLFQ